MPISILRIKDVLSRIGISRSTLYVHIDSGIWPRPVILGVGGRAIGWPDYEVDALNAARISGKTNDEIRVLVAKMMAERKNAA